MFLLFLSMVSYSIYVSVCLSPFLPLSLEAATLYWSSPLITKVPFTSAFFLGGRAVRIIESCDLLFSDPRSSLLIKQFDANLHRFTIKGTKSYETDVVNEIQRVGWDTRSQFKHLSLFSLLQQDVFVCFC